MGAAAIVVVAALVALVALLRGERLLLRRRA
jgi:hypothetical protein